MGNLDKYKLVYTSSKTAKNSNPSLTAVECSLSTHGEQDAIWTLGLDDFSYKLWCDRQEVDGIGLLGANLIGLNGGYVWVHQHCFQVLLLQHHIGVNSLFLDNYFKPQINTHLTGCVIFTVFCWLT